MKHSEERRTRTESALQGDQHHSPWERDHVSLSISLMVGCPVLTPWVIKVLICSPLGFMLEQGSLSGQKSSERAAANLLRPHKADPLLPNLFKSTSISVFSSEPGGKLSDLQMHLVQILPSLLRLLSKQAPEIPDCTLPSLPPPATAVRVRIFTWRLKIMLSASGRCAHGQSAIRMCQSPSTPSKAATCTIS